MCTELFAGWASQQDWALWAASAACREMSEMPVPKVTVQNVIEEQTIDYDEYTGTSEASETVEVRSRVYGFLQSIDFKDGDLVAEGQPLYKIEPDEYQAIHNQSLARITVMEARLDLSKANRTRNESLLKSGAVSREEYETSLAAEKEAGANCRGQSGRRPQRTRSEVYDR